MNQNSANDERFNSQSDIFNFDSRFGVGAGIFGMNYEFIYFKNEYGFLVTVGLMALIVLTWTIIAKLKNWI